MTIYECENCQKGLSIEFIESKGFICEDCINETDDIESMEEYKFDNEEIKE